MNIIPARLALAPNLTFPFGALNGTGPYEFTVVSGGGSIDPVTGVFTSPPTPGVQVVVQARDVDDTVSQATIDVLGPLDLVCDIIATELGLETGRVYIFDQKINEPLDFGMFIVVQVLTCKAFSNICRVDPTTGAQVQESNWYSMLSVDIKSRGNEALDRKEEVVLALQSQYSQQQQELNSFRLAQLPESIVSLSHLDGAAIPYQFNFSVAMLYNVTKTKNAQYYDTFLDPVVSYVDP